MKLFTTSFFFTIFLSLFAIQSKAQQQDVINLQNQIIQNQQIIQSEENLQKKLQKIAREREISSRQNPSKTLEKIKISDKKNRNSCFLVKEIEIIQDSIISKEKMQENLKEFREKCLTENEVGFLVKKATNFLINEGFVTSRAVLQEKNNKSGVLQLKIIPGILEKIVFNDDDFFDKTQKLSAFLLFYENKPLNIHEITYGLDTINRLSSNAAVIKIYPGKQENSSIIFVENKPQNRLNLALSYDDYGSRSTGKRRNNYNISLDNFLWMNDSIAISRSANDFDAQNHLRKNNLVSLNYSIPFKRLILNASYSNYSYSFFSGGFGGALQTRFSGSSISQNFGADYILFSDKAKKFTLNSNLLHRQIRNFQDQTRISVSSQNLSEGEIGLTSNFYFDNSAIFLKLAYAKGLKILGATEDEKNLLRGEAQRQYEVYKVNFNLSHNFFLSEKRFYLNYNLSGSGQYSQDKLISNAQIFAGGPFTVRGFEEGSISGDSGFILRNDLRFNLGKLAAEFVDLGGGKIANQLYNFSVTPFFDYGYVANRGAFDPSLARKNVSGAGVKISYNSKNFDASISYARALNKTVILGRDYDEEEAIYFNVGIDFDFL